jgi:carbon storage regulator
MLVLTRKHLEKIRIGESITITVLRTKGKAVRLGIEAPADVPVIRGELAFEGSPRELTREIRGDKPQDATASAAAGQRTGARPARAQASWATDSHPDVPGRSEDVEVSLRRVPRDRVVEALPTLVTGSRPLRGILDARTSTM